jgi:hypothetical protein
MSRFARFPSFLALVVCALAACSAVAPAALAAGEPTFVTKWGTDGSGDGQFSYPIGIAVDATGDVYVADGFVNSLFNSRVQKFDSVGALLAKWGSYGSGDGQFTTPAGVAVDGTGNTYVTDYSAHRVQKFDSTGAFVAKWGSEGSGDGQFAYPVGVAVDGAGNVYVADTQNHRVQKFDSAGTFVAKWGSEGPGDGQFQSPRGIAVDAAGDVYVADSRNSRLQKFDSAGTFVAKWGTFGSGDGQFIEPRGLAVDGAGNVYVADTGNNRVQKLDSAGTFVTKWGSYGSDDGQFEYLEGVAVDGAGDVYVLDSNNNRVQKFAFAANGAPAVSSGGGDAVGVEGGALTSSGSFSDPDSDALTLTADNTEGVFTDKGDGSWSWAFTPTDDRAGTSVVVTASDGNGHTVADTFVYSAANAKPVLAKLGLSTGGVAHCKLTVRTSFSDAGSADTHSGTVDWGDASPASAFTTSPVSETHSYAAAGSYPLTVLVADDDAGSAQRATAWKVFDKATGPLAPINSDGGSAFALGSTVAVIVKVVNCAGAQVTDLSPTVSLTRLKNTKATTVNETVSNAPGDTGTTMHYDADAQQYVFQLATTDSQFNAGSDLTSGNYHVKVSDPHFDHLTAASERAVTKAFNLVPAS